MERPRYTRRAALAGGLSLAVGLAGCGDDGDATTATDGEPRTDDGTPTPTATPGPEPEYTVGTREIATGFTSPVAVETVGDGRYYVVDQPGTVEIVEDGRVRPEPFLSLGDRVVDVSGYTEQGLLGLAFHPNYAENGRVFVRYSAPSRDGTPEEYSHTFVLAEFSADPEAGTVDMESEQTILEIPEPQPNHNAGAVAFGPDGYLYVATGDGGGAGDRGTGHVEDWYDGNPGGNGQDVTENLLGSMLRIDVDGSETIRGEQRPYAIPADNPLVGEDGLDEHFAWGLRNPWRFSFGPEGRLFAADVGQDSYEEINVVERGGNYGWNVREGTGCYDADSCPTESPRGNALRDPITQYSHGDEGITGVAVVGGYLYDGDAIPALQDTYVFADWRAGGQLFVAEEREDGLWPISRAAVDGDFGANVLSFGRDDDGELLVCTTDRGVVEGRSGAVYALQSA